MFHLGLAVHAFYVSHLQLEGKIKQLCNPPTFFFSTRKIGKPKLPNNPNGLINAGIQKISS